MFEKALLKQRDSSLLEFEKKEKKKQNIEKRTEKRSNNLLLQIYCDESIFLNFSAKSFIYLIFVRKKNVVSEASCYLGLCLELRD